MTTEARPIPVTYLREKVETLARTVELLEETNTVKFQRLNLATIATAAEAIKAEADKWIIASVQANSD
jgi:hypothetical protein